MRFSYNFSDFTISYHSQDGAQDVYLTMLSDWDMDAAFQNASDPCLKLKVDLRPFDECKPGKFNLVKDIHLYVKNLRVTLRKMYKS